jgi:hypothetical protein
VQSDWTEKAVSREQDGEGENTGQEEDSEVAVFVELAWVNGGELAGGRVPSTPTIYPC